MSLLVKQAGIISAADFLRLFVKTLIGILLARILSQADYGTYRQLYMIYMLLAALFMVGLPQSLYYFLPKSDEASRKKLIQQTIDIFTLLGFLGTVLLLVFRNGLAHLFNNPQLSKILMIYAIYPFFMFLSMLYYSIMIGLQRPRKAAFFMIFSVVCDFLLILGMAVLTKNLVFITIGIVLSVFIQWLYARISLLAYGKGTGLFQNDKELLKSQLRFALPIGVAGVIGVISAQVDKLVISSHFSPELFAVFAVGATELPFLGIITNSVNAVILPEMSRKNDAAGISDLYRGAVRKNALIIFPLFAFCFVFAPQIIQLLYSAKYLDAVVFFRIYLLTMPLRIATYGILFQVFNRTKYIFMISLFTLITNFILSITLISVFGLAGPAVSAASVTIVSVIIYLVLIRKKLKLELTRLFPIPALLRTLAASLISAGLSIAVLFLNVAYYIHFILGIIIFFICYYILGKITKAILPYDIDMVKSILNSLMNRVKGRINV